MNTPGRRPWIAWVALVTGDLEIVSEFTDDTEPVRSFFLTVPYPTTTISSKPNVSASNVTFRLD